MSPPFTVAVLTVSDRCSRGEATDTSGPALERTVAATFIADVVNRACVPDERDRITDQIRTWASQPSPPDLVLTTGGTGLAPRDVTPEATLDIIERRHTGLLELARHRCGQQNPRAYLSRGEAGVVGRTLVINLPGSERGAVEMFLAMGDILPHAIQTLRGEGDHPRESSGGPTPG
jgi:molybdopterin adenylyltransferase